MALRQNHSGQKMSGGEEVLCFCLIRLKIIYSLFSDLLENWPSFGPDLLELLVEN